ARRARRRRSHQNADLAAFSRLPRRRPGGVGAGLRHPARDPRPVTPGTRAPVHFPVRVICDTLDRAPTPIMSVSEYLPDGSIKRTLDVPDILAVLPVRDLVVFPYMMVPLMCSRELSTAAIEQALETADRLVLLCAQRDEADETPSADGLHPVGTIGMIVRMRKLSDGRVKVLVQGLMR